MGVKYDVMRKGILLTFPLSTKMHMSALIMIILILMQKMTTIRIMIAKDTIK